MDFGCIDMGCIEKLRKDPSDVKETSPNESQISASKLGKKNKAKDASRCSTNNLNKLTSQISKPPRRKTSPVNWFPRKKIEPYLNRKIKMLQEVDGMHSTLDETLGDSNPHYCRVLREKIAIRDAAEKAAEARKAAMVEASWCRILYTARIGSKEAEARLLKAEHNAEEAIEAARALGVIMNDVPEFEQNHYRIDQEPSVKVGGGGSSTHDVSATFETAFEVDKQVAAAVKSAFVKLASCPTSDKDDFKELLRKISENPDTDENFNNCSDLTSDCESDAEQPGTESLIETKVVSCKKKKDLEKVSVETIVDEMLDRLRCLKDDELASLATIVATCGLNAALSEARNNKQGCSNISSADEHVDNHHPRVSKLSNRMSIAHKRGTSDIELPSLDKFLVKRLTRLEREVLEAKNARKNDACDDDNKPNDQILPHVDDASSTTDEAQNKDDSGDTVSDLGGILKRHSSKLEKEIEEAKSNRLSEMDNKQKSRRVHAKHEAAAEVPSLDKFLVKHLSRLEREVIEAKNGKRIDDFSSENSIGKENVDTNIKDRKQQQVKNGTNYESLDKVLVKRISRLEKEKLEYQMNEPLIGSKLKRKNACMELDSSEGSLDQVLVKHKPRLEREKTAASFEQQENYGDNIKSSRSSRRQARERELQAAWGGLSLGNSMRPHVSRLQREKAAWLEAEEDERNRATEEEVRN